MDSNKKRVTAGVLALLLGGIGVHKFYLGQIGKGIAYILFCWTVIPEILALIEGIRILCMNDAEFQGKYFS
ncbi:MAG: TM2 domain-containing protein [Spirochaetaceae bacterium]|nr:TM2 domain-containing protein [Spirochaetaceae bacterium]